MSINRSNRSPARRLRARWLLSAFPAALCIAGVGGCAKKQPPPRPRIPVAVTPATRTSVPYVISANGIVEPQQTVSVQSQVGGILTRVAFSEGQEVREGQVLFEIDPRPYRAALAQAKATLAKDRVQAENAKRDAERYSALVQKDYVTKEQADQAQATAAAQAATVEADEAAVENAQFNLDNTIVRAPIAGRTGSLLVRQGNLIRSTGPTPLVVINQIRPILVRFSVPARDLPDIQRYSTGKPLVVRVTPLQQAQSGASPSSSSGTQAGSPSGDTPSGSSVVPGGSTNTAAAAGGKAPAPTARAGVAAADSDPPALAAGVQPIQGTLSFIDNSVDTASGTVLLKARFENRNGALWPGQFVQAALQLFVQPDALTVPSQAVMTGQQGTFVFVVDQKGTAQTRPVTAGRTIKNLTVIDKGLSPGEQVVTDGQSRLSSGAPVDVKSVAQATPESTS